jgi:hypothetical protein
MAQVVDGTCGLCYFFIDEAAIFGSAAEARLSRQQRERFTHINFNFGKVR